MLVITRKEHQRLIIKSWRDDGEPLEIVVELRSVRRGPDGSYQIRVGVDAPRDVMIMREEVYSAPEERRDLDQRYRRIGAEWREDRRHE